MKSVKEVLGEFVESKSQFFNLSDGEEKIVKFLSAAPVTTNYRGKETASIRYQLEFNGKEMSWDRTSREFASQMQAFEIGDTIKIKRSGQKNKTKYCIEKIK
jgi:hypothetical protein